MKKQLLTLLFSVLLSPLALADVRIGVSIAQVSRLLGHADASFTLRVYISVLPDDLPSGDVLAAAVGV